MPTTQPLVRRTPDLFGGLSQLYRELDQFFDAAMGRTPDPFRSWSLLEGAWAPPVDICEDKDVLRVKAEVPGLKRNEIDVSMQGDSLILKGERKQEFEEKKENYHRVERRHGQFYRAIPMPVPVNAGGIKATYKDGILEVTLPKKEEAKSKQIEVETK